MKHNYFILIIASAVVFVFSLVLSGGEKPAKIDKDNILKTGNEWMLSYDRYVPDLELLEALKGKMGHSLRIDVYLGLWCPDSLNHVPKFIKIMDRLETDVPVNYYTVQRKASKDIKYFVEDLKVERVPTFIFYRDGKEIGRIVENPQNSLLEDFLEIVF